MGGSVRGFPRCDRGLFNNVKKNQKWKETPMEGFQAWTL